MKKGLVTLFLLLACAAVFAQAAAPAPAAAPAVAPAAPAAVEPKFTVDEERFFTKFKAESQPKWEERIETAAGKKIAVEVDWSTFAGDLPAMEYLFSASSGDAVISGVCEVCGDEVGKNRFSKVAQKVVLKHDRASKDDKEAKVELANGVFTITYNYSLNGLWSSVIQKAIEKLI